MQFSTRRAAIVGAVLALVCVAAVGGAAVIGNMSTSAEGDGMANGPVLVAVALPDAEGVLRVRQIDVVQRVGATLRLSGVDPLTSATVPGTSASTLSDAFSFGGGAGLAAALSGDTEAAPQAWVVVGPDALQRLVAPAGVTFSLQDGVEVFDGAELYSYPAGSVDVPVDQVAKLMNGAAYLAESEQTAIQANLGDVVVAALAVGYTKPGVGIDTNLTGEQLQTLFTGVKAEPVRADSRP